MLNFKALSLFVITALSFGANALAQQASVSPMDLILSEKNKKPPPKVSTHTFSQTAGQNQRAASSFSAGLKTQRDSTENSTDTNHITWDIGIDKSRYEALEKRLTASYGAPKSERGGLQIWEVDNPDAANSQAKKVTIMAGRENGTYFVTADRRDSNRRTLGPKPATVKAPVVAKSRITSRQMRPKIDYSVTD